MCRIGSTSGTDKNYSEKAGGKLCLMHKTIHNVLGPADFAKLMAGIEDCPLGQNGLQGSWKKHCDSELVLNAGLSLSKSQYDPKYPK